METPVQAPVLAIVDDDRDFGACLADVAERVGIRTRLLPSLAEAVPWLAGNDADLTMLDMTLPDGTGLELLERLPLKRHGQIVFVSGTNDAESIRRAVSTTATEFISKPLREDVLERLLQTTQDRYRQRLQPPGTPLLGLSPAMDAVRADIARVAPTGLNVLIAGETGTGKELVAAAIHQASGRRGRLVSVNCGALPAELMASQLFGHERGAFTGANARHAGFFEQAAGGTLFLDEIGEMPPALQVYLLRVLETRRIVRVGGTEEVPVDVRIVAATQRGMQTLGTDPGLRPDLFYRLGRYVIEMPPLRARGEDVFLLADAFIDALNREHRGDKRLDPRCRTGVMRHAWPGNVRELMAATERAYLVSDGDLVNVVPLPHTMAAPPVEDASSVLFRVGMSLQEIQDAMLHRTLAFHGGDKTATARSLGVSVRTIHNQLARSRGHG
nr:sigma-54 dependent transcriptional regulator [Xanthomonas sp. XNM01]